MLYRSRYHIFTFILFYNFFLSFYFATFVGTTDASMASGLSYCSAVGARSDAASPSIVVLFVQRVQQVV